MLGDDSALNVNLLDYKWSSGINFKHFGAIARPHLQSEVTVLQCFHQLLITFNGFLWCINTLNKLVPVEVSVNCSGCYRKFPAVISIALLEAIIGKRWGSLCSKHIPVILEISHFIIFSLARVT